MTEALRRRGPDDGGIWLDSQHRVGLGHRRLAVVDLSTEGKQPMKSAGGRYTAVLNGEIYNHLELRERLTSAGHRFRGHSDTEAMNAAFEAWGIEPALERLEGMFAIAVWDAVDRRMTLARDRVGVKPLYFRWHAGALYFSSELSVPFAHIAPTSLDRRALSLYFRHNFIPAPWTVYAEISKLEPGTVVSATAESAARGAFERQRRYWDPVTEVAAVIGRRDAGMDLTEAVDRVDSAIGRAVRKRAIADVPLGAFLSGGIDSSLISAHLAECSPRAIETFTIGFSDRDCDEAPFAREIASRIGSRHTEFIVTEAEAISTIPLIPGLYGEPFADSSQIPTYLVSKLTRSRVTVALSGDGGDELFSGYSTYQRLARAQDSFARVPELGFVAGARALSLPIIRDCIASAVGAQKYEWLFNGLRLFSGARESFIPAGPHGRGSMAERLVLGSRPGDSLQPYRRASGCMVEQKMTDDFSFYLPEDILTKVDRASMAVALEVRVPLVDDLDVFRAAWEIPFRHKNNGRTGKIVLREALARRIPRPLFERPKKGFSIPLGRWLEGPLRSWFEDLTSEGEIKSDGILNAEAVSELKIARRVDDEWTNYKLWGIACFQAWRRETRSQPAVFP
jgi:asparagine synthase (glutamine-hydrolysing)